MNKSLTVSKPVDVPTRKFDVSKALKLRLYNCMSYGDIADLMGVTKAAVHKALKPFVRLLKYPEKVKGYQEFKAEIWEAAEMQLVRCLVDPVKLEKASLNNVAYALTQLNQAIRLERGQSTANVSTFEADRHLLESLQLERVKLEKELKSLVKITEADVIA